MIACCMFVQSTVEAIGASAGQVMQAQLPGMMQQTIIPSFNEACHNMFLQLNAAFQTGAQECEY